MTTGQTKGLLNQARQMREEEQQQLGDKNTLIQDSFGFNEIHPKGPSKADWDSKLNGRFQTFVRDE